MKNLLKTLALGILLTSYAPNVVAENAPKEKNQQPPQQITNGLNGLALRFSEYGHVSGFWGSGKNSEAIANTFLYIDGAIRYGQTVGDSPFWLGGEINPLNISWEYKNLPNAKLYDYYYYFPTASIVLGVISNKTLLNHVDIGVGYCLPIANNTNSVIKFEKGGIGFKAKIGSDYLINDHLMVGLSGELRYTKLGVKALQEPAEVSHLEYSIGFTIGYQF